MWATSARETPARTRRAGVGKSGSPLHQAQAAVRQRGWWAPLLQGWLIGVIFISVSMAANHIPNRMTRGSSWPLALISRG
jgi:hypothetical protein